MRVDWSALAEANALAIADYISRDSLNAALLAYQRIREQVDRLAEPAHRPARPAAGHARIGGARNPYVVIYRVEPDAVLILRVVHGRQAWPPKR